MKDVFVISEKQEMFNLFNNVLGRLPIHLSWAKNMEDALDSFPQEKPSLVFIVNEDEIMLTDWVEKFNTSGIRIPFVCFTRPLSWAKLKMIWDKGAIEVIRLPMHKKELEFVVKTIVSERDAAEMPRDKAQGKLDDVNLIELIQYFEDGNKSGVLHLMNGIQTGYIEFTKGKICNARLDEREPLEAIEVMATWFSGQYRMIFEGKKYHNQIKVDNRQIIIDCLNHINEQQQLLSQLPDKNTLLFTNPDVDYEESAPSSRKILLLFKDGLTIKEFLNKYAGKTIPILRKLQKWLEESMLLTKDVYDKKRSISGKMGESGGLKKIVSKVFSKEEEHKSLISSGPIEETVIDTINKRPHLFNDFNMLQSFLADLEEKV